MLDSSIIDRLAKDTRERVRARRRAAGVSQAGLAGECGVTRSTIAMIESGGQGLTLEMLFKVAAALGCSAHDLLPELEGGRVPTQNILQRFMEGHDG